MKTLIAGMVLAASAIGAAGNAFAAEPIYAVDGVALSGYDAVAYFTDQKAVKGKADFETEWSGAKWRFSTAANRAAFAADPRKYAPQFGGYCAWAVSKGYTYKADPEAWRVVDGKLYLNYDRSVQEKWARELPEIIDRAARNWPAVLSKPAK